MPPGSGSASQLKNRHGLGKVAHIVDTHFASTFTLAMATLLNRNLPGGVNDRSKHRYASGNTSV